MMKEQVKGTNQNERLGWRGEKEKRNRTAVVVIEFVSGEGKKEYGETGRGKHAKYVC